MKCKTKSKRLVKELQSYATRLSAEREADYVTEKMFLDFAKSPGVVEAAIRDAVNSKIKSKKRRYDL